MLAHISQDEEQRLKELRRYGLLDTPPEPTFDRITMLAARIFNAPIALIVLVDRDRQWFKSRLGIEYQETPREDAFCAHTIQEDRAMIVPDACADGRFVANPQVTGEPHYRFYAGMPLTTPTGYRIGTVCVLDTVPRHDFGERETAILNDLAGMVCDEMELRAHTERGQIELDQRKLAEKSMRAAREELELRVRQRTADLTQTNAALCAAEAKYRGIFENAIEGIYQTLPDGTLMSANPALARLLGYGTPQSMIESVVTFASLYVQTNRRADFQRQVEAAGFVAGFESEVWRSDGGRLWISENARAIHDENGRLLHYEGTVEDVSARRAAEEGLLQMREELENRVRERTAELALANGNLRLLLRERETADAVLRRSEARFRAMIENAQDLITILNLDGTMLYQSPSVEHIFGFKPEELVGKNVMDQVHPEDRAIIGGGMERILGQGENYVRVESRLLHRDGNWRLIESIGSRTAADSPIAGLVVNSRDITERRQAELLHETRTRQQTAIAELSRFALDGSDLPAIFEKSVALVAATLGVKLVTLTELMPGGTHLIIRAAQGFAPGVVGSAAVESWRHAQGYPPDHRTPIIIEDFEKKPECHVKPTDEMEERPVSAVSVLIQGLGDPFGTLCAMSATSRRFSEQDVVFLQTVADLLSTAIERRRNEDALLLVEKRHQRIVANTPGMVFQFLIRADRSVAMLFVSEESRVIYGLEPQAFYEHTNLFWETVHEEDRPRLITGGQEAQARIEPFDWEGRIVLPSGEAHHVSIRTRPERMANGDTIWDGVVIDVSELKRAEAAMQTAKEEAERANNAKSEFLSRISHELRTPLNAILGFGQLLEMEVLSNSQRSGVEQIVRGGRQLLDLINEVLDIARIESGNMEFRPEPVSVCELFSAAILLVEPLARAKGVSFAPVPPREKCPDVLADRARLSQVLINLLSNAIKYNTDGGRVSFGCCDAAPGRQRHVITDTGPGMTEEEVARLFTPFERLDAPRRGVEGTGLGLAISRALVSAMDGSIGVQTEPGKGSSFYIDLPAAPVSSAPPAARPSLTVCAPPADEPPDASAPFARRRTLLHVESQRADRELVEQTLFARPEVRLLESRDGESGLMRARIGRPDLILFAPCLPDMDGEEFLRRLRAEPLNAATPVIILQADAGDLSMERLRKFGVHLCLEKPLDEARFLHAVDGILTPETA